MHNLVEITAVFLIMQKFEYFARLLENAYSRPENRRVKRYLPHMGSSINAILLRHIQV